MIDEPIYRRLRKAVGKAHGDVAIHLLLKELSEVFEMFGEEIEWLYEEDPEKDDLSIGYYHAADWLSAWSEEILNGKP